MTETTEDRLRAFADRGGRSGPALRQLADDLTDVQAAAAALAEAVEELTSAADEYENAEPGSEGADDRTSAWDTAQEQAGEAASALGDLHSALVFDTLVAP
jgi:hypothetical protein